MADFTAAPRISCVIPAYNCAAFVDQAVASVLAQRGPSCEVIVVNDGSTDGTRERLQAYAQRVTIIHQPNRGVSAARNRGLQAARGNYVVFLDADDVLLPGKFSAQAALLDADARLGAVHSGWRIVDEAGTAVGERTPWQQAPRLDLAAWLMWKPVFLGAMMFRRAWLRRVEGFAAALKQAEDVDFLLRLSLAGCRMVWLRQATVCYRQHGGSTMQNGRQQARDLTAVLDNFFARPDLPRRIRRLEPRVRYYTLLWLVWQLDQTGDGDEMVSYLRRSQRHNNFPPLMQVHHWLGQLLKYAQENGRAVAELRRFWPPFQRALGLSDAEWQPVARSLEWWLVVWWHYLRGAPQRADLEAYRHLSVEEVVQLVQGCLVGSPQPVPPAVVARFWRDAQRRGLVPPARRHAVLSLYLTLWGQSVLGRRWRTAVAALGKVVQHSLTPRALPVWGRFVGAAVRYLVKRPFRSGMARQQ